MSCRWNCHRDKRGKRWGSPARKSFDFAELNDDLRPRQALMVKATSPDGKTKEFPATVRIDTPVELEYYRNGGILHTVLRKLMKG